MIVFSNYIIVSPTSFCNRFGICNKCFNNFASPVLLFQARMPLLAFSSLTSSLSLNCMILNKATQTTMNANPVQYIAAAFLPALTVTKPRLPMLFFAVRESLVIMMHDIKVKRAAPTKEMSPIRARKSLGGTRKKETNMMEINAIPIKTKVTIIIA